MHKRENTNTSTYRGYTINTGKDNTLSCYTKTLNQIINHVEDMTRKHSKVLAVRLDCMLPKGEIIDEPSRKLTRALESTQREIQRKHHNSPHNPDFRYIKATERSSAEEHIHFHVLILVNGNAIQNGYGIKAILERNIMRIFETDNNGLVHFSASNGKQGMMIVRSSTDFKKQIDSVVYAGSYLAKVNSKQYNTKGTQISSCSRLPKDQKTSLYSDEMDKGSCCVTNGFCRFQRP